MRIRGDNAPPNAFTLENCPKRPGFALARFFGDVRATASIMGNAKDGGYEYDEYTLELKDYPGLGDDILENYDAYFREATESEIDSRTLSEISRSVNEMESQVGAAFGTNPSQFNRAVQLFVQSLSEDAALEVPSVFKRWQEFPDGYGFTSGDYLTCGFNSVGDPQLYVVIQSHVKQADWTPPNTPTLYRAVGVTQGGYPVWSRPSGAHDTYSTGDVVDYYGTLYVCQMNSNVYSPDEYPPGWSKYTP